MREARRIDRPALGLAAALLGVAALVLARPDDGALYRSASSGTAWTEHLIRVNAAALRADGESLFRWLGAADYEFPPLLHWVAVPLGSIFGHDAGTASKFSVIWLVVMALATAVAARSVTGDRATGALAGALLAMIPAIHGTAVAYYYDLPMSAWLWVAAAALLSLGPTRPVRAGLVAGGAFLLACLSKWTALVLAPPLVLGVLLTSGEHRRRVAVATGVGAGVAAVSVLAVLSVMSTSLKLQLQNSYGADADAGAGGVLATVLDAGGAPFGETLVFLSVRLVIGGLGPLLAVVLLGASAVWAARSRAGAALVASVIVGDLLLIAWLFPALNDRWLISMVPALAITAAAGLTALPDRARPGSIALAVAVGLAVTWDFHHGDAHAREAVERRAEADWNELRSWGAASASEPALGWARGDYLQLTFLENREWLWAAIVECGARDVLIEDPGVIRNEDDPWWRYRDLLHRLETGERGRHIATLDGRLLTDEAPAGPEVAIAVLLADRTDEHPPAAELVPGWELRRVVEGWADAPGLGLWVAPGSRLCLE